MTEMVENYYCVHACTNTFSNQLVISVMRFSCHVIEVSSSLYLKFWRTDTLKLADVTRYAVVTATQEAKRAGVIDSRRFLLFGPLRTLLIYHSLNLFMLVDVNILAHFIFQFSLCIR